MATKRAKDINVESEETEEPQFAEGERLVIPVIQEEVTIDKHVVEVGKVRISKRVSEHEELVDIPLFRQEVNVERVPMNLFVEALPPVRQEGDTMIIPVVEERIIVQKKLLLVEELRVKREAIEEHQPQTIKLMKEEVEVKRTAKNRKNSSSDK